MISIGVMTLWARYGAPKSFHTLTGFNKFMLEVFVYGVGSISFYNLFGIKIGTVYLIIVLLNLFFMYVLKLQRH